MQKNNIQIAAIPKTNINQKFTLKTQLATA